MSALEIYEWLETLKNLLILSLDLASYTRLANCNLVMHIKCTSLYAKLAVSASMSGDIIVISTSIIIVHSQILPS